MKLLYLLLFFTLLFIINTRCESQINISGLIVDSSQKPITGASVTLHKSNSNIIVAFAITNAKGLFSIHYNSTFRIDSFFVKANVIGYAIKTVQLKSSNQQISFVLNTAPINLPNVTVQNPKPFLKYKADTLSYAVDSFTQKQDRTIGDVLRKMPGIEVDANGKISYNGKSISNFYIDGDNLLDDKYNIATNSIAANMVKDVQVLENHQPIKVLKDATVSDKVAINLNLKDKARLKLTARVELGAGFTEEEPIYDGTITAMAFKKKYKAINTLKANNVGKDLANDIVSHNIADYFKAIQNNVPAEMLGLNTPNNPAIGQQRSLFNQAALINSNNLLKTKKELQIKINFYYLYDNQSQTYSNNAFFYLPTDTIKYLQQQNTKNQLNLFRTQINLNSNKDNAYWNNTTVIENNKLPANSTTNLNGNSTKQSLLQENTNISNEFNYIQTTKRKKIIEWYSYISYLNKPENLQVNPGVNAGFFNNGINYSQLIQNVNIPTYFTNNYINFRLGKGKVLQSYQVGFTSQWQELKSSTLAQQNNNSINNISDSFINKIQWEQQKIYANANFDYLGERLKISIYIPTSLQNIQYTNIAIKNNIQAQQNRLFINPRINLKYATGVESFINANYNFINQFATIQDVYGHYILPNYNQLIISEVPFKQSSLHSASLNYSYRKTIKILFFNIGILYNNIKSNNIYNTNFLPNIQTQTLQVFNNSINSYSLFSGISKYIFKLHTTVGIKANVRIADWNQMQKNILTNFSNNNYTISASITPKVNKWLNMGYSGTYMLSSSKEKNTNATKQSVTQMQHTVEANIFMNDNLFIKLKGEEFFIQQQNKQANNYFFADGTVTYKANKIKTDFVLELFNIANTKTYSTATISANNFTESSFAIRPRMFLLKAFFNF